MQGEYPDIIRKEVKLKVGDAVYHSNHHKHI